MADKKSNNKSGDMQAKRRLRIMQIMFVIFSVMLILSMVLSAVSNF
jgi:cytochrome c-type biogenesis protein CcmE